MALLDKLTVRNDGVLVRPLAESTTTAGGLHIPEANREKPRRAVVLAIGTIGFNLHVGDVVLYTKYAGVEVDDAENLLLLSDREIFLVVPKKDVVLVEHADPRTWHLNESPCELCEPPIK